MIDIETLRAKVDPRLTDFLVRRFATISQDEYQRFIEEGNYKVGVCRIDSKVTGMPFLIEGNEVFVFTGKDIVELERNFQSALAQLGKFWVFKRPLDIKPRIIVVDFKQQKKIEEEKSSVPVAG